MFSFHSNKALRVSLSVDVREIRIASTGQTSSQARHSRQLDSPSGSILVGWVFDVIFVNTSTGHTTRHFEHAVHKSKSMATRVPCMPSWDVLDCHTL